MYRGRSGWTEKIPTIAGNVAKHDDSSVGFVRRTANDLDVVRPQTGIRRIEVVDSQEQADAPAN